MNWNWTKKKVQIEKGPKSPKKVCQKKSHSKDNDVKSRSNPPIFHKNWVIKSSFVLYKCLCNIWMVPEVVCKTLSSDLRSLVSSFILCTAAFKASFSSSSDSKKAFLSMAEFIRPSKSSSEANVLLERKKIYHWSPVILWIHVCIMF